MSQRKALLGWRLRRRILVHSSAYPPEYYMGNMRISHQCHLGIIELFFSGNSKDGSFNAPEEMILLMKSSGIEEIGRSQANLRRGAFCSASCTCIQCAARAPLRPFSNEMQGPFRRGPCTCVMLSQDHSFVVSFYFVLSFLWGKVSDSLGKEVLK